MAILRDVLNPQNLLILQYIRYKNNSPNIRGLLLHNFGDFCAVLEKYTNIYMITLSETHIIHTDSHQLFQIPEKYTFVSIPRTERIERVVAENKTRLRIK